MEQTSIQRNIVLVTQQIISEIPESEVRLKKKLIYYIQSLWNWCPQFNCVIGGLSGSGFKHIGQSSIFCAGTGAGTRTGANEAVAEGGLSLGFFLTPKPQLRDKYFMSLFTIYGDFVGV